MAKLYFYYSAMNAGKSTYLLQSSYNYKERNMNTLLFTAAIDDRYGSGRIQSRIGLAADSHIFSSQDNLLQITEAELLKQPIHCIMVDEAQFLTKQQVLQLAQIADELNIPVLAFGIRTDFKGELFEGSQYLLAWADNLNEIKTICHCGRKATMVLRIDDAGNAMQEGTQVEIGGNGRYISVCRKHFRSSLPE